MSGEHDGELEIRRPQLADVPSVRAAHEVMIASDDFAFAFEMGEDDDAWLANVEREERGIDLPSHLVRASFLIGLVGGRVVGRVSVRHQLNDHLAWYGGHVGYGVVPDARGNGYATALARAGLALLADHGTDTAMITCEADNAGSVAVIENLGGVLRDTIELEDGTSACRYDVVTG